MNRLIKFFSSASFKLFLLFILDIAIILCCSYFGYLYAYFGGAVLIAVLSIFCLANRRERDAYKVTTFLLILMLPLFGIGYAMLLKENKGNKKIRKEWSDIIYRNRKSIFQSNDTMQTLKNTSPEVFKTCNYIVDSVGMPCIQNANFKYYSFGEAYYKSLFEECKNAKSYILFECYKIVPGKLWTEFFDILRLKAREGVLVKILYDEPICTKYISKQDFEKMKNHGIETVPFNNLRTSHGGIINCRNYKRMCIIDGKIGFFGGFNVDDEYVVSEELKSATKDCGVQLIGDAVKNLIVMYFEDYQFATKKIVNLQDYFVECDNVKTKDWALSYSTNPISLEHTNKNILLSLINNAKDTICITTSYLALDDELRNALIVNAKSGVKVKIVFSTERVPKSVKFLARSYFYELMKEGVEVYEFNGGKMTTKLILIDNSYALISTNSLDCSNTYKHFNGGIFLYGESVILMQNDMREIINSAQIITIKDLQKRKIGEKISATWSKFLTLFK